MRRPADSAASRSRSRGTTMVEVVLAVAMMGLAMLVMVQQITISYREVHQSNDRMFAYRKATAMLAELQDAVNQGKIKDSGDLDAFADQQPNPVLTTRTAGSQALAPDHSMSGNLRAQDGEWRWFRRIEILAVPELERSRYARIVVQRRDDSGAMIAAATLGAVLSTPSGAMPAVAEHDVYLLAIDAAPSLWMPLPSLRSVVQSEVNRIQQDAPSLRLRLHWITKFGYGRDPAYAPYVNDEAGTAIDGIYWYPGKLSGAAYSQLFAAEQFSGRVRTEAGFRNGYDAAANPYPHAVADEFNHCMRLPRARTLFAARVQAGLDKEDEPPLQILLADLHADPARFRNAIFVNLHGEGLPFPPMRNYSDAAKLPDEMPGVRVVTHPRRLWTPRDPDGNGDHADSHDLELRVYAYKTDPAAGPAVLAEPITIEILGPDLTARVNGASSPTLLVHRLQGGVSKSTGLIDTSLEYDGFDGSVGLAPPRASVSQPYEMSYECSYRGGPEPATVLRLYATPLVAPMTGDDDKEGLNPKLRLYGMEYVPSPVDANAAFANELNMNSDKDGKNTARWRIRIPKAVLAAVAGIGDQNGMVTVRTRIGADTTTGILWPTPHQPFNLSETYAWWARTADAVPLTERFQLLGDPRHNPYADLCATSGLFAHGYNWFFDDLKNKDGDAKDFWRAIDEARLRDGFAGAVAADVPRMMQIWRQALQRGNALFAHVGGRMAQCLLLGGEIALPAAAGTGEPSPVLLDGAPFGAGSSALVESIGASAAATVRGRQIVVATAGSFFAKSWLGEIFPDGQCPTWQALGNLLVDGTHVRLPRQSAVLQPLAQLPFGTSFDRPDGGTLGGFGIAALMQTKKDKEPVFTAVSGGIGLTAGGNDICAIAGTAASPTGGFTMALAKVDGAIHHDYAALFPEQSYKLLEVLADAGGNASVSLIADVVPSQGSSDRAVFLIAAETAATPAEHKALARRGLLYALRAFHVAGEAGLASGSVVPQVPRLEILAPAPLAVIENPTTLNLRFATKFVRFDNEPYTVRYPTAYQGEESQLRYVVTYSRDGQPFRYASDRSLAAPGLPANTAYLLADTVAGDEGYVVALPTADFPSGRYVFHVACYDVRRMLHRSTHQVKVEIERAGGSLSGPISDN